MESIGDGETETGGTETVRGIEDYLATRGWKDSSKAMVRRMLRSVEKKIGKPLEDATTRDVDALRLKLGKMGAGPVYAAEVRRFFQAAGHPNLAARLKMKRSLKRLPPDALLTREDVNAMITATASTRDRALIALLWDTGVRIHELLALNRENVTAVPVNGGFEYRLWFPKVKVDGQQHEGRVAETASYLTTWLNGTKARPPSVPVFESLSGQRMAVGTAENIVRAAAKRAGITKRVWCHLFRHSRATDLRRQGMDPEDVKILLGWAPGSNVMETRYSHLTGRDAVKAYRATLGLEPEAAVPHVPIHPDDGEFHAVLPMMVEEPAAPAEIADLMRDPKVLKLIQYLQGAAGKA